jgi:hypothetical protein
MTNDVYKGYQDIEVIAAPTGWMVAKAGSVTGSFDSQESAYKNALALCDALFEEGVRAFVRQAPALNA